MGSQQSNATPQLAAKSVSRAVIVGSPDNFRPQLEEIRRLLPKTELILVEAGKGKAERGILKEVKRNISGNGATVVLSGTGDSEGFRFEQIAKAVHQNSNGQAFYALVTDDAKYTGLLSEMRRAMGERGGIGLAPKIDYVFSAGEQGSASLLPMIVRTVEDRLNCAIGPTLIFVEDKASEATLALLHIFDEIKKKAHLVWVQTAEEARAIAKECNSHVVGIIHDMLVPLSKTNPEMSGTACWEMKDEFSIEHPGTLVIFLSGNRARSEEAQAKGAVAIYDDPQNRRETFRQISDAFHKYLGRDEFAFYDEKGASVKSAKTIWEFFLAIRELDPETVVRHAKYFKQWLEWHDNEALGEKIEKMLPKLESMEPEKARSKLLDIVLHSDSSVYRDWLDEMATYQMKTPDLDAFLSLNRQGRKAEAA